jgi:hypothetical protein
LIPKLVKTFHGCSVVRPFIRAESGDDRAWEIAAEGAVVQLLLELAAHANLAVHVPKMIPFSMAI